MQVGQLMAFLDMDPGNVVLACDLLDEFVQMGTFDKALACIERLPVDSQNAVGIRFRKAQLCLMLGLYSETIHILEGLISEGHEGMAMWHDLAFAQLCAGHYQAASETLADAESKFGSHIELMVAFARVHLLQADFELALLKINQALAIDQNHPVAMGLRALILLDSDDLKAAGVAASECLVLHADQHEALLTAGTLALWRQHIEPATQLFQRALVQFPNSGRALSGLGQVMMLQNQLPQALDILTQAVEAMPNHIGTWHALAWTQLLQGDVGAAELSYNKAFELDRNFADSHGGLALIHALKGNKDFAEQSLKRAFRLNPDSATAIYAKSILLHDIGDTESSEKLVQKLIQQNPSMQGISPRDFTANLRKRIQPESR